MLERSHRLTSSAGFGTTVRQGRRAGSRTLVGHLRLASTELPSADQSAGVPLKVGFVVGKAVGNAVTRNRVKRRLRALARERLDTLPDAAVLVVRALPAAAEASYVGLGRDLDAVLARVSRSPERSGRAARSTEAEVTP